MAELQIGILVFPEVQQLDFTGPYEVFASLESTKVHLVAATLDPIKSVTGLIVTPSITMDDCPQLDVVCVPGGSGVNDLTKGPAADAVHAFLRSQAEKAQYITSVCTGSFVLAAAGLLKGVRCTSHWLFVDLLEPFGAIPVHGQRVVEDGRIITGGGVTCGIDFALTVAARLRSDFEAQKVQLYLEYDPNPPFGSGSPEKAPPALVREIYELEKIWRQRREVLVAEVTGNEVKKASWAWD